MALRVFIAVALMALFPGLGLPAEDAELLLKGKTGLQELVDAALAHNPRIQEARQQAEASQGRILSERSGLLPQVGGQAGWRETFTERGGGGGDILVSPAEKVTTKRLTLGLNQSIFDWARWSRARAANHDAEAARESHHAVRDEVVLLVRKNYARVLEAEELVTVGQRFWGVTQDQLKRVQAFFSQGLRAKVDVAQASLDASLAELALVRYRGAVVQRRADLAVAVGLRQVGKLSLAKLGGIEIPPQPLDIDALSEKAQKNRPEMKRKAQLAAAAEARLSQARGGYFPTLDLGAELGKIGNTSLDRDYHTLGLTFYQPIFSGLGTLGRVREQEALFAAARAGEEATRQEVNRQVVAAVISLREARSEIRVGRRRVALAQENHRLAKGRYDNQIGTALEMSQAQLELARAEAELVQARYRLITGLAELDRALGGSVWAQTWQSPKDGGGE